MAHKEAQTVQQSPGPKALLPPGKELEVQSFQEELEGSQGGIKANTADIMKDQIYSQILPPHSTNQQLMNCVNDPL